MKRILVYEHLSGAGVSAAARDDDGMLAMGQAMRDAVVEDLIRLEDYEVSVATRDPALPVPAAATPVTPRPGESARDFVARQGDAHHLVWVVAPETDGILSDLQRSVDPARWIGCDGPAIKLASSKRATLMRLAAAGLPTPLAFEHAPETTRWVVKPDDGAGALATQLHPDPEVALADWSLRSRTGGPMAIEPWVDGEALSLSLLCCNGRSELLSVNRQHVVVDADGVLSFRGVEVNVLPVATPRAAWSRGSEPRVATLRALATRIGRTVTGLCGFVGIDLVWHAQRGPVVIEINPRVTCAYVGLSRALGRNLAAEVIAALGPGAARGHA
ncbi:MAG: ATP-grasp domain-containing protein [Burkholderiaceae bacterium]